ncbi:MAG TPA: class I SAM-dependent rRNA methyltransferase [Isosphaeraceae bacterium]|nr:class I SAM-dependent rRNA methyltransferase [Isosphaeraceae bacterium]
MSLPRVLLKPKRSRPFFAGHPWVFAGSIGRVEGDPKPGDEVAVASHEGTFIARGLFNPQSAIRVRLYRWEDEPIDEGFWRKRMEDAVAMRRNLLRLEGPHSAARLVFSEADGVSGLTVDRYDRWAVAQVTSLGVYQRWETIAPLLREISGVEGLLVRSEKGMAKHEGMTFEPEWTAGTPPEGPVVVEENGLRFALDLEATQKTGFYLDQRENRKRVAELAEGKRVLDLYCYSGGFALNAKGPGKAAFVRGVDSSGPAVEQARSNAERNGLGEIEFEEADVPASLASLKARGERFDMVVCDPPKFAQNPKGLEGALKKYVSVNRAAVEVLEPGGVLVTCSCSGLVDRRMFADVLAAVAERSGRTIQILEQRGQAPDHPVSAACLESDYLKCFVCRVK